VFAAHLHQEFDSTTSGPPTLFAEIFAVGDRLFAGAEPQTYRYVAD
jgi:hypothetical protein